MKIRVRTSDFTPVNENTGEPFEPLTVSCSHESENSECYSRCVVLK